MKKIFIVLLCVIIMCAMTVVSFADEAIPSPVDTAETESVEEGTPSLTTEDILNWIKTHPEEVSVIVTVITSLFVTLAKLKTNNKTNVACNNNAIAIAENSNAAIQDALNKMTSTAAVVERYKGEILKLLEEIRQTDSEKRRLETALTEVENYLKTAKLANIEFSNELAELLVLANIPNSKKDELYARHRKAVDALDAIELSVNHTEVEANDGEET